MAHTHHHGEHDSHTHDHSHHNHDYKTTARKSLVIALAVNGVVMIAEAIGGYITGSLSLLSDAGHMLTHIFALATSLFAIILASRPVTDRRTYGWYRAEVLASFVNSIFLIVATVIIVKEAASRAFNPVDIATGQMIAIACVGLITNLVSFFLLKNETHNDMNIRSAFLHVLSDTFSSAAIIIGGFIIRFTGFTLLDPILSVLIAVLILIWAWKLIRESTEILLESTPRSINPDIVKKSILGKYQEVEGVHDFHCWVITGNMFTSTMHITMKNDDHSSAALIVADIIRTLESDFHISHSTIQVDKIGENCPTECSF
ncbi:MAG: cation transporter [Fibrobacteres bacterium]|nr:cation transporter [Fibrobacterota bacterium]